MEVATYLQIEILSSAAAGARMDAPLHLWSIKQHFNL